MYKDVLKVLAKDNNNYNTQTHTKNSTYIPDEITYVQPYVGPKSGVQITTADRAVTFFQHLVGVGGYNPDLECFELLVKSFEISSLNLKSSPGRLIQTYPSRALEVAEHMLSTGITPSKVIYESLLRMWVVSRRPDSPRITESIFRSMVSCIYSASAIAKRIVVTDNTGGESVSGGGGMRSATVVENGGVEKKVEMGKDTERGDNEEGERKEEEVKKEVEREKEVVEKTVVEVEREKERERDEKREIDGRPSRSSFLLVLEAWARSPLPNAATKVSRI